MSTLRISLWPGTPRQVNGLCRDCALPALAETVIYMLVPDGVRTAGTVIACLDCGKRQWVID